MDIHEFLLSHDLISIGGIEKKLGLTKDTLGINRPIPEKYMQSIINILIGYGYKTTSLDNTEQTITPKPIVTIQKNIEPVIYNNKVYSIRYVKNDLKSPLMQIGIQDGKLFRQLHPKEGDQFFVNNVDTD